MLDEFNRHNLFHEGLEIYEAQDPHLAALRDLKFVHPIDWWREVRWDTPGIYLLTGGRQIGKSTSTKLMIRHLLEQRIFPSSRIFYLPCDQIDDHHHLSRLIRLFLEDLPPPAKHFLVVIDEITYVKEWDRAIKALADDGSLGHGFCIITGSDSVILREAASRFPGRRGQAAKTDFHLHPLSFCEYVQLTDPSLLDAPESHLGSLFDCFDRYQRCGGYLRAINDLHAIGEVRKATYLTFEQWIRGDFERRHKNTSTLLGVLHTVFSTLGSQVTYSALAHKMGQVVKETFIDYLDLLKRMDVLFDLQAFDQNTRLGFPKKARKLHFLDPFIMDTIERWLIAERHVVPADTAAVKVESIVASQYRNALPCYYLKGTGEVDLVVVDKDRFVPIEVKWTGQLRSQDLKQIAKYPQAKILTKQPSRGVVKNVPTIPLPLFLVSYPKTIP